MPALTRVKAADVHGDEVELVKTLLQEEIQMRQKKYPSGWNERKLRRALKHYESQSEDEAIAEDEAAYELKDQTMMVVPRKLVPEITKLVAKRRPIRASRAGRRPA